MTAIVAAVNQDDAEPRIAWLRARSRVLAPIPQCVGALDQEGILARPIDDVMCSIAHRAVNRLLKRGANHDELRAHDALARLYDAQIARERSRLGSRAAAACGRVTGRGSVYTSRFWSDTKPGHGRSCRAGQ